MIFQPYLRCPSIAACWWINPTFLAEKAMFVQITNLKVPGGPSMQTRRTLASARKTQFSKMKQKDQMKKISETFVFDSQPFLPYTSFDKKIKHPNHY